MGYAHKTLEYTFWAIGSFQNFLSGKIFQVKVKLLSHVQLFATPWTVALKAPLSMEFFREEYWSGLHFLRIFPTQVLNLGLLHCKQILYRLSHWGSPRNYFSTLCALIHLLFKSFMSKVLYNPHFVDEEECTGKLNNLP